MCLQSEGVGETVSIPEKIFSKLEEENPNHGQVALLPSKDITNVSPFISPSSSVNEAWKASTTSSNEHYDLLLDQVNTLSQSLSDFVEPTSTFTFYQINDETKDEVRVFLNLLQNPLGVIVRDHTA